MWALKCSAKVKSQKRISMIWAFGSDVIENWLRVSLQIWLAVRIYAAFPMSIHFPELEMHLSLWKFYKSVLYNTPSLNRGIAIFWIICCSFQFSKPLHHSSFTAFIIFLYFIMFLPKVSSSSTNRLGASSLLFTVHTPRTSCKPHYVYYFWSSHHPVEISFYSSHPTIEQAQALFVQGHMATKWQSTTGTQGCLAPKSVSSKTPCSNLILNVCMLEGTLWGCCILGSNESVTVFQKTDYAGYLTVSLHFS